MPYFFIIEEKSMYFDAWNERGRESNPFPKQLGKYFIFNDEFFSLRILLFSPSCFVHLGQNSRTRISATSDQNELQNDWIKRVFTTVVV